LSVTSTTISGVNYAELIYNPAGFSSSGVTTSVTTSTASGAYTETSGNTLLVLSGGSVTAATIDNGASLVVSGGSDTSATISSGGTETVSAGSATGDQIYGNATVASAASVTSETVGSGGTLTIDTGATQSATTILVGGSETVQAGFAAGDEIFGTLLTVSGDAGVFTGETVENGGTFDLYNGNSAAGTTVLSGGLLLLSGNNGAVTGTVLSGGGTVELDSPKANISGTVTFEGGGNTFEVANIASSGFGDLAVLSGFSATDKVDITVISAAGATLSFTPNSGAGTTSVTVSGTGGSETFVFGGLSYDTFTLSLTSDTSGGAELAYNPSVSALTVSSGQTVSGAVIGADQTGTVQSGGTVISTIIEGGGSAIVSGTAIAATIWSGGSATIFGTPKFPAA
jgi:autotransporter passenger strand-loop-strand repeat protein